MANLRDLVGIFTKRLIAVFRKGFNSSAPTVWTIEGLLQYIEAPDVDRLFARVDAFSAGIHQAPWSRAEAGARQSPIWLYRATRGGVGNIRRFRPMCPERHGATSSRR